MIRDYECHSEAQADLRAMVEKLPISCPVCLKPLKIVHVQKLPGKMASTVHVSHWNTCGVRVRIVQYYSVEGVSGRGHN